MFAHGCHHAAGDLWPPSTQCPTCLGKHFQSAVPVGVLIHAIDDDIPNLKNRPAPLSYIQYIILTCLFLSFLYQVFQKSDGFASQLSDAASPLSASAPSTASANAAGQSYGKMVVEM